MKKTLAIAITLLCCGLNSTYAAEQMIPLPTTKISTTMVSQNQQVFTDLLVEKARAKATIPGVKVSAGYLTLTNNSEQTMHFIAAQTSAAKYTEFHNMIMDNSKMVMRKVDTIQIKPQQRFIFKEKGYHLMFMGLKHRFTPKEIITVTLIRKNGQRYDILLPVMEMQQH